MDFSSEQRVNLIRKPLVTYIVRFCSLHFLPGSYLEEFFVSKRQQIHENGFLNNWV